MDLILTPTVKRLLDLFRAEVESNTVISTGSDYTEVAKLPAVVLDDFSLIHNTGYRRITFEYKLKGDTFPDNYVALKRRSPHWFDLLFSATLITGKESALIATSERILQLALRTPYLTIQDPDTVAAEDVEVELTLESPALLHDWNTNRSNVRDATVRFRLSALPLFDKATEEEIKLVKTLELQFHQIGSSDWEILTVT